MVSQNMVSQPSYGSIIWFLNYHMVSQLSYGSIIWFLNHHMVSQNMVSQSKNGIPKYGFSIEILVNYMFPNQTSAFSRYPATDSSKCASATDSMVP